MPKCQIDSLTDLMETEHRLGGVQINKAFLLLPPPLSVTPDHRVKVHQVPVKHKLGFCLFFLPVMYIIPFKILLCMKPFISMTTLFFFTVP